MKAFMQKNHLVEKYVSSGTILDVGCSTGEMIEYYNWSGDRYGMEIVEYAIEEAKKEELALIRSHKY